MEIIIWEGESFPFFGKVYKTFYLKRQLVMYYFGIFFTSVHGDWRISLISFFSCMSNIDFINHTSVILNEHMQAPCSGGISFTYYLKGVSHSWIHQSPSLCMRCAYALIHAHLCYYCKSSLQKQWCMHECTDIHDYLLALQASLFFVCVFFFHPYSCRPRDQTRF